MRTEEQAVLEGVTEACTQGCDGVGDNGGKLVF